MNFCVNSQYSSFSGFADCPELLTNISSNYTFWKDQLEEEEQTGQVIDKENSRNDADKNGVEILDGSENETINL